MLNGLEHTVILSHFFTFITGSSSRLLRIRFSADLAMYWFPVCHFRCKEFNPLVIWIWNQNIVISTIVGTSSHINKTKVLLPPAYVTIADFGYPVQALWLYCSPKFNLFCFPIFRFWAYPMKVIPKTRRAH